MSQITVAELDGREAPLRKCSECGFLALINNETRQIIEAELTFREDGRIRIANLYRVPLCFHRIVRFETQMPENTPENVVIAINNDYPCDKFEPWRQGYSPREHQDMIDRQWEQSRQDARDEADRKWRQECDERDRAWREMQAENERRWREKQSKDEDRRHHSNLLVMGLLTIAAGLVGAAIQAGWVPSFFSWMTGRIN